MARERASPPRTPQRAIQIAQNLIDSAHESPASRTLLRRVRKGGEEARFRTKSMSGELKPGISRNARGRFKSRRVGHNTRLADVVDPPVPVLPPPSAPPTVNGYVGRPAQDARIQPPKKMTRSATAAGWGTHKSVVGEATITLP